jgi:hypothetical protein
MEKSAGRPKVKPEEARKPILIRPRPDMDAFIRSEAQRNGSSLAGEVYRSIRERMDREASARKAS